MLRSAEIKPSFSDLLWTQNGEAADASLFPPSGYVDGPGFGEVPRPGGCAPPGVRAFSRRLECLYVLSELSLLVLFGGASSGSRTVSARWCQSSRYVASSPRLCVCRGGAVPRTPAVECGRRRRRRTDGQPGEHWPVVSCVFVGWWLCVCGVTVVVLCTGWDWEVQGCLPCWRRGRIGHSLLSL